MAPKRSRSASFDNTKFVSKEASDRYTDGLTKKVPIPERGFGLLETLDEEFENNIQTRGWQKFCGHPEAGIVSLIREFYANAWDHVDGRVSVRGKMVKFDSHTINSYYGLRDIPNADYNTIDTTTSIEVVTKTSCPQGTE